MQRVCYNGKHRVYKVILWSTREYIEVYPGEPKLLGGISRYIWVCRGGALPSMYQSRRGLV